MIKLEGLIEVNWGERENCQHSLQGAKRLKHLLIQPWHKHIPPIPRRESKRVCVCVY